MDGWTRRLRLYLRAVASIVPLHPTVTLFRPHCCSQSGRWVCGGKLRRAAAGSAESSVPAPRAGSVWAASPHNAVVVRTGRGAGAQRLVGMDGCAAPRRGGEWAPPLWHWRRPGGCVSAGSPLCGCGRSWAGGGGGGGGGGRWRRPSGGASMAAAAGQRDAIARLQGVSGRGERQTDNLWREVVCWWQARGGLCWWQARGVLPGGRVASETVGAPAAGRGHGSTRQTLRSGSTPPLSPSACPSARGETAAASPALNLRQRPRCADQSGGAAGSCWTDRCCCSLCQGG